MFFTQEDYRKIEKWFLANSRKDTDFAGAATPLKGNETVVLVQNGKNVKASVKDVVEQLFLLGVSDFVNITDKYGESYISLSQAIELIPFRSRKIGQVVTFLDDTGKWAMFQFQGTRKNQWGTLSLWVDLIALMTGFTVIDSEDIVTETNSANQVALKFADKVYSTTDYSGLGRVYLRKNITKVEDPVTDNTITMNLLQQSMISKENTIYIVQYSYSLNRQTISIPKGSILLFEGGTISDGIIIGDNTTIIASIYQLFSNIIIEGTWNQKNVYSDWFDFKQDNTDNIVNFRNLMKLSTSDFITDVYISEGEYYTSVYNTKTSGDIGSEGIQVPSNTHIYNSGTIKAIANSYEKTSIFFVSDVDNVIIEGGKLIGDIRTHIGTTGEWGYGIALIGARNTTIKNIVIEECWGDGINVQSLYSDYTNKTTTGHCKRILIDNVKSLNNRRQGISIEGCIGAVIRNSEFSGTGSIASTAPGAGIDIEPWYAEQVATDIVIDNCKIFNNKTYLAIYGNNNTKGISILNCESDAGIWIRTSNVNIDNWKVIGSSISGYLSIWGTCHNINVTNSRFTNEIHGRGNLQDILINSCVFDMTYGGTWSGFAISFEDVDETSVYKNITISNSYFKDTNKSRFLRALSTQPMKIDFISNEVITNSQYGVDIGYGDFIGNSIVLTNSNNHSLGLSVKNTTGNTVTIADSSFKLKAYTDNVWNFSGDTIVSDTILYDFEIANVVIETPSIWRLFGGTASSLKVRIQNCNFGQDITAAIAGFADWVYKDGYAPMSDFTKSLSPLYINATANKCYEYIVPYKRGYVEIMTSNKYLTQSALFNAITMITINPDRDEVIILPSEVLKDILNIDDSDATQIPAFATKVDGATLHIYIKSPNNTTFGLRTKLTVNYQENVSYNNIKYSVVSTPSDITFQRKVNAITKATSFNFDPTISRYLGWKIWDANLKEAVYNGEQWLNQDGTLVNKVVII